jgi:hypothetical protein
MGLVGKPEGNRPFVTPRRRWEYNIKMDLKCDGMARIDSGYGQVAGCCEFGNEPPVSIKCGEFLDLLLGSQGHCFSDPVISSGTPVHTDSN